MSAIRRIISVICMACVTGLAPSVSNAKGFEERPFWHGKPKLEAKMRDDRAILVSVRTDKGAIDKAADFFSINGVGYVRRDADTVFSLAKRFDRLKDISDVFRVVTFDAKSNRVFVICEALGYQARMLVQVDPTLPPMREIGFKVLEGHFVGLEGVMRFRELKPSSKTGAESEVSLRIQHEAREIPIPKVLVGIALEVLIQRVASKMRTYFESEKIQSSIPAKFG